VGVEQRRGRWRILYKCEKCGKGKVASVSKEDDFGEVLKLVSLKT